MIEPEPAVSPSVSVSCGVWPMSVKSIARGDDQQLVVSRTRLLRSLRLSSGHDTGLLSRGLRRCGCGTGMSAGQVASLGKVSASELVVMVDIDGGVADLSAFTHLLTAANSAISQMLQRARVEAPNVRPAPTAAPRVRLPRGARPARSTRRRCAPS